MVDDAKASDGYLPISAYAIIGDCHTTALISRDGSIDWYCPTRFDAPAVFCRLLDAEKGGYMRLEPVDGHSSTRRYSGDTNILETTFSTPHGRVRLTDLMPVYSRVPREQGYEVGTSRRILRLVESEGADLEMEVSFKPTFDYAQGDTGLSSVEGGAVAGVKGQFLTLTTPGVRLEQDGQGGVKGRFHLAAGERKWVALTEADDPDRAQEALRPGDYDAQLERTRQYWDRWVRDFTYRGPYRSQVLRSALVLKLLTYEPTGAIVAAPTASLPEDIGGVRNWDYRYSWLRDASLILYSLMSVGYQEEATDFLQWLHGAHSEDPGSPPQIMYTLDGKRELPERNLDHLDGYRHSRPVRVGNKASEQLQLDIFGEILRAAYLHYRSGSARRMRDHKNLLAGEKPSKEAWTLLRGLVEQAAQRWEEPDNGVWEMRIGKKEFLYSRLMCWAALDRGIRMAHEFGLPAPMEEWHHNRSQIRQAILTRGYHEKLGSFTQTFGGSDLDATALTLPIVGFLPATDPRIQSTIARIRADLSENGLVYRYHMNDGLPGKEGTFALCSFWLVDALALGGRSEEARDLFEQVLSCANDVGLLSEEIDAGSGELLGNFPQGFTHLALIRSALDLAKVAKHGAEEHPETEPERAQRARQAVAEGYAAHPPEKHPRERRKGKAA